MTIGPVQASDLPDQGQPPLEAGFSTSYGPVYLTFDQDSGDLFGSYPDYAGALNGAVNAEGQLDMIWSQRDTEQKCETSLRGSWYWGRVLWTLDAQGNLSGGWSYCDAPAGTHGQWTGHIQGESPAFLERLALTDPVMAGNEDTEIPSDQASSVQPVTDGEILGAASAAFGDLAGVSTSILTRDFTCDGVEDKFLGAIDPDHPGGPAYIALLTTNDPGISGQEKQRTLQFTFSFNQDTEMSLCSMDDNNASVEARVEEYAPGEAATITGLDEICDLAVALDDGMCDQPRLFWHTHASREDGETPWRLFRN